MALKLGLFEWLIMLVYSAGVAGSNRMLREK